MEPEQRLAFCQQCTKRDFNKKIGIVCSLTDAKPTFEQSCEDFTVDSKVVTRKAESKAQVEDSKMSTGVVVGIVISVILLIARIALRVMRD